MKLKLNEKLPMYGFNTLIFFFKPILPHALEKFSTLSQYVCLSSGVGFVLLRNQNITLIGIREKKEDLGEQLKTHVSKIYVGS